MPLVPHLHQQPLQRGTSKGSYLHSKEPERSLYVHPAAASRKHTSNTARHSERHTDAHVGRERDTYEREREGDERGRRGVKSPSISPIVPLDTHRHTHARTPSHSVSPTSLSPSPIDFTVIDGGGGAGLEKRSIYSCDHAEEWIVGDTEGEKGECEIDAPLKGRRGENMTLTSTSRTWQHRATHGNTLHHTAAHCNTLQHDECDMESATDAHVTMFDDVSPNAQHVTEVALLKSQLATEYSTTVKLTFEEIFQTTLTLASASRELELDAREVVLRQREAACKREEETKQEEQRENERKGREDTQRMEEEKRKEEEERVKEEEKRREEEKEMKEEEKRREEEKEMKEEEKRREEEKEIKEEEKRREEDKEIKEEEKRREEEKEIKEETRLEEAEIKRKEQEKERHQQKEEFLRRRMVVQRHSKEGSRRKTCRSWRALVQTRHLLAIVSVYTSVSCECVPTCFFPHVMWRWLDERVCP